jgi:aldehyde:ferredoxin oxidoreductase
VANGYMGKILWIDLSMDKITEEALDEKICHDYIGGYGIGARILFDRQRAKVDPLGPENILGFVTGPLTGTQALGGSRYAVVAKSPLTGTWGDANSGGNFGPYLRFSGFDGVFFIGQATKPVYLFIDDGNAQIRDADHLWGKDSYETEDILKNELGQDTEIVCIGPAGEKLSLISGIINNKGRAAGRSGLGAVMGAKKIKAIAVKGQQVVPVFNAALTAELRKKYISLMGGPAALLRDFGTSAMIETSLMSGDAPVKNWGGTFGADFKHVEKIDGNSVVNLRARKYGCYSCPLACGGHMKKGTGEYKYGAGVHKPEYQTIAMFGSNCLNDNLDSIIMANDICNRAGLDTISAGACIVFTIECYERGLITKQETGGIEMTWGNHKSIIAMLNKLAKREGFGSILADGVKKASDKIGKTANIYGRQIQGQETAAHNSKTSYKLAVSHRMDATPGKHTRSGSSIPPGVPMSKSDPDSLPGRAESSKISINFQHVEDCTGLCQFVATTFPDASVLVEFMNAITGGKYTMDELLKAGERINNIRHVFNLREGLNPLNYKNPDGMVGKTSPKLRPVAGKSVDEDAIDREYCLAMDWDIDTTRPSDKKLKELGMGDIAKVI